MNSAALFVFGSVEEVSDLLGEEYLCTSFRLVDKTAYVRGVKRQFLPQMSIPSLVPSYTSGYTVTKWSDNTFQADNRRSVFVKKVIFRSSQRVIA